MFKIFLIAFVLFVHSSNEVLGESDSPWKMRPESLVQLGATKYYFESDVQSNWYLAQEFCRANGMQLLSIETQEENQMIVDYLTSVGDKAEHWTSGSDLGLKNNYVWMSTGAPVSYTNWFGVQPDHSETPQGPEHVIELRALLVGSEYKTRWNDVPTAYNLFAICEDAPPCTNIL